MIDFWDQKECRPSGDDNTNRHLNDLPMKPGEPKCVHLMGEGRVCLVGAVLGTSLLENPQVRERGAAAGAGREERAGGARPTGA